MAACLLLAASGPQLQAAAAAEFRAGLVKYDAATGKVLETADFEPGSSDPHGLAWHNGVLYSCDAGIHPGWAENKSPTHGYIFRIDLL